MKKTCSAVIALAVFGMTDTVALASTACHRIVAKDHIGIALKGHTEAGKFFQSSTAITESQKLPTGQWSVNINTGGVYPFNLSVQNPAICGKMIEYKVRLTYKGKIMVNEDQSIPMNRWSPIFVSKPDHIQVWIKADHKVS